MNQFEAHPHSFIVKIWPEGMDGDEDQATWHGHITHIPGGERRYLKDLDEIVTFVALYLKRIGVRVPTLEDESAFQNSTREKGGEAK